MNTFAERAVKFTDTVLDLVYKKASVTAILEVAGVLFDGTKTVKMPEIDMDGAADYDRATGYVAGDIAVSYTDHTLAYDRGRKFNVDVIDDDEAAFDVFRLATTEYVRKKEVPETDAIRFTEIYAKASAGSGTVVAADDVTTDPLGLFDTAESVLFDNEVPDDGRVMFVSSAYYKALKTALKDSGRISYTNNNGEVDRRIMMLDGMVPIIKVPKSRFYDVILLNDGTTGGQEAGGFAPISATSHEINFILLDKAAAKAITKRHVKKTISPEMNQSSDGWLAFYRQHHDLIVAENETPGIYIHRKATAVA